MNLIVNFTPTGMIPTKAMTPFVPIAVPEIVEDVHKAYEIGITMVHIHARDEQTGAPTYSAEIYSRIIDGIRKFSEELVICVSLSGRTHKRYEHRAEVLQLDGDWKPDMGSLTLSSVNFNHEASLNAPQMVQMLAAEMQTKGILPELEAFDVGMINYAKYLQKKGLIEPPFYFNLLFGNIACAQANLSHVATMINDLPDLSYWSLAGIGDAQLPMNTVAIAMGGGVRVGLEDNIWYDQRRTQLATNMILLNRVHKIAKASGRGVMTSKEFRKLFMLDRRANV
jgi:uncharacterized protein (DUF849 family)